jgi:hypothetical protein
MYTKIVINYLNWEIAASRNLRKVTNKLTGVKSELVI